MKRATIQLKTTIRNFRRKMASAVFSVFFVMSCSPIDQLSYSDDIPVSTNYEVFFATNRALGQGGFNYDRSAQMAYGRTNVSVPPFHKRGKIEYPGDIRNPLREFGHDKLMLSKGQSDFVLQINARLANKPAGKRDVVVFVHGYNNTFDEALYLNTQLLHDASKNYLPVMFTWPSRGKGTGYLRDKDSVLYSRAAFESLLTQMQNSNAESFTVIGHSIGSLLIMETMRQNAIRKSTSWSKLRSVILVAPDIDRDLFNQQVRDMNGFKKPLFVISSEDDILLRVSNAIAGGDLRLGAAESEDEIGVDGVTIKSVTYANDKFSTNHMTAFQKSEILDYIGSILP